LVFLLSAPMYMWSPALSSPGLPLPPVGFSRHYCSADPGGGSALQYHTWYSLFSSRFNTVSRSVVVIITVFLSCPILAFSPHDPPFVVFFLFFIPLLAHITKRALKGCHLRHL